MPRRATPEALGLRRVSPLSIRRGAPCLRNPVECVSPLGLFDGDAESQGGQGGGWVWRRSVRARKRRFSPQSKGGGQAAAKMPRQARLRLLDGDAESVGGQGGVGFGGVLCGPESGDAKRPRRATPEALGLRRESPLSLRRGAPWWAEPCRARQSSGALDGDAESVGGGGGVGFGGVLCAPESGDSRRSPRAADKPPLRGLVEPSPVEPRRRPLDCGEYRRSL